MPHETRRKPEEERPFGFNVIGNFSTIGLGQSARALVTALAETGHPVAYLPLYYDTSVPVYTAIPAERVTDPLALPYRVNLFINGLPDVALAMIRPLRLQEEKVWRAIGASHFLTDRYVNVGIPFWELPKMPTAWATGLAVMDAVLAASDYIRSIVDRAVPSVPQATFLHPVDDPAPLANAAQIRWRERLRIAADSVVFVSSFDPNSYVARKNPLATFRAFTKLSRAIPSASLIVKTQPLRYGSGSNAEQYREIAKIARAHPGIHIVEEYLPYDEVMGLYAQSDVYVSTHRSEGLGLGLLEAMGLSMPVIATAWSGNMSFMNEWNSVPVKYRLEPVYRGMREYNGVSTFGVGEWAEIDADALVRQMIDLATDSGRRRAIGEAAREAFLRHARAAQRCTFATDLEEMCAHRAGSVHRESREDHLESLRIQMLTEGDELRSPFARFVASLDQRLPWLDQASLGVNRLLPWRLRWRKE